MAWDCGVKMFKVILILINVLLLFMGATVTGVAGYVLNQPTTATSIIPQDALVMAIFGGAGVTVFSVVGCFAGYNHNRPILFVYSLCVLVFIGLEVAGGLVIGTFLNLVKTSMVNDIPGALVTTTQHEFVKQLNKTYLFCCVNNPNSPLCSWISSAAPGCVQNQGIAQCPA